MIYPWQVQDWQKLQAFRSHWPHALLVLSEPGMGEREFMEAIAQSFLCQTPLSDGMACRQCDACSWFEQGAHPDYQLILPEIWMSDTTLQPEKSTDKKTTALSKEIKVEQIRELSPFCYTTAYAGGKKIVMIYPAESMNMIAANALLKMLEEPPENVLFILGVRHFDQLLPTIISRCQQFKLSRPDFEQAKAWLKTQQVASIESNLAQAGGAPLLAQQLAQSTWPKQEVLSELALFAQCDVRKCVQLVQKSALALSLSFLQKWCYDLSLQYFALPAYYFPDYQSQLSQVVYFASQQQLNHYIKMLTRYRLLEQHPLNIALVYEELFYAYQQLDCEMLPKQRLDIGLFQHDV